MIGLYNLIIIVLLYFNDLDFFPARQFTVCLLGVIFRQNFVFLTFKVLIIYHASYNFSYFLYYCKLAILISQNKNGRSPTRASQNYPTTSNVGGSQPDLSKLSNVHVDSQITFRKRKEPERDECQCSAEVRDMRSEIVRIGSLLEKYVDSNENILLKMHENIADIKEQISDMKTSNEQTINTIRNTMGGIMTQINDIKSTTTSVLAEQTEIKEHVKNLEMSISLGETKMKSLEAEITNIKQSSQTTTFTQEKQLHQEEQIIQEVQNRNNREKNIVLVGLPESSLSNREERMSKDENDVLRIITSLSTEIPKPIKVFRIGKYKLGKNRSLKVCFDGIGPAKQLLRNKDKLPDDIKIYSDQTPAQQHYLKVLKDELKRRENNGLTYQLPNYTHYFNYRTNSIGGGVSAYVHNDLKHCLSESKYVGGNNYLWIHLEKYGLDVGVVYNPGHTNFKDFLEEYELQLENRRRAIIFGDFNIDLLVKDKETKEYNQLLKESGHKIINKINKKHYTRECKTRKSILDHICTNLHKDNFHMILVDSSLSDHRQLYLEIKNIKSPPKSYSHYEAINYSKLYDSMKTMELQKVKDYTELETLIKRCTNESKVNKTKILNLPQKDWINKEVLIEIDKRNALWLELKKNPDSEALKEDFRNKRNEVTKLIHDTKKTYYYKEFVKRKNDPKKIWNLVNTLTVNKLKRSCAPPKLILNSKEIKDPHDICQTFNSYFSSIGTLLANEIPSKFHHDCIYALPQPIRTNSKLSHFEPCGEKEISDIINSLDPNCSVGLDGISTKVIKCTKNLISTKLAECFNKLFDDATFPDTMKIAKVTPIFKSGLKTDPGNYRPISVLPALSKILEKTLHVRLEKYLESISFISERQYGFRSKSNTLTATIDLITKIKQNIDDRKIVLGIFIDLKKAFDTHNFIIRYPHISEISSRLMYLRKNWPIILLRTNHSFNYCSILYFYFVLFCNSYVSYGHCTILNLI
ncbi:hypothetical protein ABMA28_010870 [Loxostege sticticalis]|uniref:Reverse transcriptase domain-containing protein n=1 Tax=Loxostege sticticalis TaxID=481309 RepID=A0ABD0S7K8_LOXSC